MSKAQIILGLILGKVSPEDYTIQESEVTEFVDKNGATLLINAERLVCIEPDCSHGMCVLAQRMVFQAKNGNKTVFEQTKTDWQYPPKEEILAELLEETIANPGGDFPIVGGGSEYIQ